MNIRDLLNLRLRSDMPKAPTETLPVITERLNGGAEDPSRVSTALAEVLAAKDAWSVHSAEVADYKRAAVATGTDEAKRRRIRDAAERAAEELALLNEGEPAMRARLAKAEADTRAASHRHALEQFVTAFEPFVDRLQPVIEQARSLVQLGEQIGDPRLSPALMVLAFTSRWFDERDLQGLRASVRALVTAPVAAQVVKAAAPPAIATPAPTPLRLAQEQPATVSDAHRSVSLALENQQTTLKRAERTADDLTPLAAGEVRARVLRSGYTTPVGVQCHREQLVRLRRTVAIEAQRAGAIEIVEEFLPSLQRVGDEPSATTGAGS